MKQPSPGLYAAVLSVLSGTAPRSRPMASTMEDLADGLTTVHAEYLPGAIGDVLPLLRGDPERLRFAASFVSRFDLFEATEAVADMADAVGDRDLLLNAATLCGNPAVLESVRQRVSDAVGNDPVGRIRLDPDTVTATDDEQYLQAQCWPGAITGEPPFPLAPVVVLDCGLDALGGLRLAIALDRAGAVVRRLAPQSDIPFWFGSQTVLVCRERTSERVLNSYPGLSENRILVEDSLPDGTPQIDLLLSKVGGAVGDSSPLRIPDLRPEVSAGLGEPKVLQSVDYRTRTIVSLSKWTGSGSRSDVADRIKAA